MRNRLISSGDIMIDFNEHPSASGERASLRDGKTRLRGFEAAMRQCLNQPSSDTIRALGEAAHEFCVFAQNRHKDLGSESTDLDGLRGIFDAFVTNVDSLKGELSDWLARFNRDKSIEDIAVAVLREIEGVQSRCRTRIKSINDYLGETPMTARRLAYYDAVEDLSRRAMSL
jgi:hypothetical protein